MDVWETLGLAQKRCIILHHDDLGSSLSTNQAYLSLGFPTGSIMAPGAWAMQLRTGDLGVHLTLTSEWDLPRMRPLTAHPSLRDETGHLWQTLALAWAHVDATEAEAEMRAQIDAVYALGIDPTHLDTHMGAVLRPDLAAVYHRLALEYRLPCLLPTDLGELNMPVGYREALADVVADTPLPTVRMIDTYRSDVTDKVTWYVELLNALPAGVYHLLHHAAVDGPDTRVLPDAHIRIGDFEALQSPQVRHALSSFRVTTYREIRDAWRRLVSP